MRIKRSSCDSTAEYLTLSASPRALAFDLPPGLKSRRINQLSSHPRVPRPDFTEDARKTIKRGRKMEKKVYRRLALSVISRAYRLAGKRKTNGQFPIHEDRNTKSGLCPLFANRHARFSPRSLDSRDERALRAPLKATPDSKRRPFPAAATLAPEPPVLLLPPCPVLSLSLRISLSVSVPLPASFLALCTFLCFSPSTPCFFLSEFYHISVRFRIYASYILCTLRSWHSLSSAISSSRLHSISGNFSCPSMTAEIGRSPIFADYYCVTDEGAFLLSSSVGDITRLFPLSFTHSIFKDSRVLR